MRVCMRVCVCVCVLSHPGLEHFWRMPLLCSTSWTFSCLDSFIILQLRLFSLSPSTFFSSAWPQHTQREQLILEQEDFLPAVQDWMCTNRIRRGQDKMRWCQSFSFISFMSHWDRAWFKEQLLPAVPFLHNSIRSFQDFLKTSMFAIYDLFYIHVGNKVQMIWRKLPSDCIILSVMFTLQVNVAKIRLFLGYSEQHKSILCKSEPAHYHMRA